MKQYQTIVIISRAVIRLAFADAAKCTIYKVVWNYILSS